MKKIILLYSYTYLNANGEETLLYNTLDGSYVVIENREITRRLQPLIHSEGAGYLLELTGEWPDSLLESIHTKRLGQVLECQEHVPIQFSPSINIDGYSPHIYSVGIADRLASAQEEYEKVLLEKDYDTQMGKNLLDYFSILTLYYSNAPNLDAKYADAYKQYLFPCAGSKQKLDIPFLRTFLDDKSGQLEKVNLVVGEITAEDVDALLTLISYLRQKSSAIYVYAQVENQTLLSELKDQINHFCFWVLPDTLGKEDLPAKLDAEYRGLVTHASEMQVYPDSIELYPYCLPSNREFCRNESAYDIQNVLDLKPTENEIRSAQFMNANLFGELSVLPSGEVYSCLPLPAIGKIQDATLKEILYKEFRFHKNWFKVRRNTAPCHTCIYNWICPPITNYERVLGTVLCTQHSKKETFS